MIQLLGYLTISDLCIQDSCIREMIERLADMVKAPSKTAPPTTSW